MHSPEKRSGLILYSLDWGLVLSPVHVSAPQGGSRSISDVVGRTEFHTVVTTAQLSTPPELIASATGIIIGIRALGGSVGIPICELIT